jgi:hypothetical protein
MRAPPVITPPQSPLPLTVSSNARRRYSPAITHGLFGHQDHSYKAQRPLSFLFPSPLDSEPPGYTNCSPQLLTSATVFVGNQHTGETSVPPSSPSPFLSPLHISLTRFGGFSCTRSTRPSPSRSHHPPLQVWRGTADEPEHLELFNLTTELAVAVQTSSAHPSTLGTPAAMRTPTPQPQITRSLGCSGELLPFFPLAVRSRSRGSDRFPLPNRYRPIVSRHVACPVGLPSQKLFLNSNSNLRIVTDLVKSIENKILSQKLQIIPCWNP